MAQAPAYPMVPIPAPASNIQNAIPVEQMTNINLHERREKKKLVMYQLGILESVLACFVIVLEIVAIGITGPYYSYTVGLDFSAPGVWCGAFLLASGILGIVAKSRPSVRMYNASLAMCIVAACFMVVLITMSTVLATDNNTSPVEPLRVTISAIGGVGLIILAIHSIYFCTGCCDQDNQAYQGAVLCVPQLQYLQQPQSVSPLPQQMNQPHPQQVVVQLANGQLMLLQGQPVMAPSLPVTSMPPVSELPPYEPPTGLPQQQVPPPPAVGSSQPVQITKDQGSEAQETEQDPLGCNALPDNQA